FYFFFFFFQAEDGIRDFHVTGVQTCALPISPSCACRSAPKRKTPASSTPWQRCCVAELKHPNEGQLGRLVVVGLGLIGGSFAKGMRATGLFREVVGVDLDADSRRLAVELGVVDRCEADLATACRGADVIQLAVPILVMEKVLAQLATLELGSAI